MSCIYGRYKKLICLIYFNKEIKFGYSIACPSITSSTESCLPATAKLHFLAFTAS